MVDGIPDQQRAPHVLASYEGLGHRLGRDMARHAAGVEGLRGSHGRILDLIARGGTRPSALAEGATISKQAVSQRIRELVARGWVELHPDPSDGRALLVHRTSDGDDVRGRLREAIRALESEWAGVVGAERYAVFRSVLDELAEPHLPSAPGVSARGSGDG